MKGVGCDTQSSLRLRVRLLARGARKRILLLWSDGPSPVSARAMCEKWVTRSCDGVASDDGGGGRNDLEPELVSLWQPLTAKSVWCQFPLAGRITAVKVFRSGGCRVERECLSLLHAQEPFLEQSEWKDHDSVDSFLRSKEPKIPFNMCTKVHKCLNGAYLS